MVKREQLIIAVIAAAVIGFFVGRLTGPGGTSWGSGDAAAADSTRIPTEGAPSKGPKKAKVVLVEVSDFQCPFCSRGATTVEELGKIYKDSLRIVFRNNPLPFHKDAPLAAEAALAANAQGKFWEMHDRLFANQKALQRPELEKYAGEIGLDLARFKKELDAHTYLPAVQADMKLAGELGASGTPAFFINGVFISGAQPIDKFRQVIDAEIAAADTLVKAGTPLAAVYAQRVNTNFKAPAAPTAKKPAAERVPRPQEDPAAIYSVPLPGGETYAKGPKDALVTIMEFSDFQCPYCKKGADTMHQVAEAYPKDVRIIFRHNPLAFHDKAPGASQAALAAAEQGKFWEMHDLLFANAPALDRNQLESYAQQIGLNMERFRAFIDASAGSTRIDGDQKLAAQLGARGTPAFFINGRKLSGAQPLESFKALIDEELKKARAQVEQGVPAARIYEKIVASGSTGPVFLPMAAGAAKAGGRQTIALGDAPTKGSAKAPVQLVIFSDFQCPYCSQGEAAVAELMKTHGDRVLVAYKFFPLSFHKAAFPAAEAALAAKEQGKFWEMHDLLFRNQKDLTAESFRRFAQEIGLNMGKFDEALKSGRFKAQIDGDLAQGRAVGVDGTPTLFVNGRKLEGGWDEVKGAVEKELQVGGPLQRIQPGQALRPGALQKLDIKRLPGQKPGQPLQLRPQAP